MKKPLSYSDNSGRLKIIIPAAIIMFLLLATFFNFFFAKKCAGIDCFNSALLRCKKAEFLSLKDDSKWLYTINGAKGGNCMVNVKNVFISLDEAKAVQGKSMVCSLPKGVVMQPEGELGSCHGLLKEALQDIIIERLHTYIVQNIGQISESITKPI